MKQINYYPAANGWDRMWTNFAAHVIDADFAKIRALGADSVRVFVQPSAFGYPAPTLEMRQKLSTAVYLAASHGLSVHLTLFDWWHDFTDVAGSKAWAKAMLAPYVNDARVGVVELKNEVDPTNAACMTWVNQMAKYVKLLTPGARHTVSIADKGPAAFQSLVNQTQNPPDFWSYHYYGPAANAVVFTELKRIAGGRPLFIGEAGQSTYGQADLNVQANYLTYIAEACQAVGLGLPSVWTLNDFTTTQGLPPAQCEFGLYRVDGSAKPSVAAVRAMFA